MIYQVSHRTAYHYQSPVMQSQHLIHLTPRAVARQSLLRHSLIVEPAPSWRSDFTDYYGNPAAVLGIEEEHKELVLHARSTIELVKRAPIDVQIGQAWEGVARALVANSNDFDLDVMQFALPSPATPTTPAVLDFARPSFAPGRPALAVAWDLTHRIFDTFKFDSTATDVSTPVDRVLELKRGVCQDFAHLSLACLRAMRVPARYVSGYLMTHPPAGQEKLQGADASHAWISVWTPEIGWVDFDPTNRLMPDDEHITFAYGREYGDISPVTGVLLGGGAHAVEVSVDVDPQGGRQP